MRFKDFPIRSMRLLPLVAVLLFGACQMAPQPLPPAGPAAVEAGQLRLAADALVKAKRSDDPKVQAGQALFAAEIAWDLDWKTSGPVLQHDNRKAARVYDTALMRLLTVARKPEEILADRTKTTFLVAGPRGDYRLTMDESVFQSLKDYPEIRFASDYRNGDGFRRRITREGLGLPLVGINRDAVLRFSQMHGNKDVFKRREGYTTPRTAVLAFGKPPAPGQAREVRLSMVDPRKVSEEKVGSRVIPVAADFTAPVIAAYPKFGSMLAAAKAALNPDRLLPSSGIYSIELYDPERIPVLLVHGLFSTPDMWKNLINELNAAPGVGNRFQFYTFTYPTGLAPAYSARMLREKIAVAHGVSPLPNGYVLIGHSMGGILSRMQITDSGRTLWDTTFGEKAEVAYRQTGPNDPLKQNLIFRADPQAKRAIFICVPHRGSPMAEKSIVRWFSRLAHAPLDLTTALASSPLRAMDLLPERPPSSADGLSPNSPTLRGLDKLPMQVPVHSIIGDRGKAGPLAESSDGVVPYWSSHQAAAASEKIVPAGHGGFDHPEAVAEIERILREHPKTTRLPVKK